MNRAIALGASAGMAIPRVANTTVDSSGAASPLTVAAIRRAKTAAGVTADACR